MTRPAAHFYDHFRSVVLPVSVNCGLSCFNCPHELAPRPAPRNVRLRVSKVIRATESKRLSPKLWHIVGGDPAHQRGLLHMLHYIAKKPRHIVLWTTGVFDSAIWDKILPYVQHVCLYTPSIYKDTYRYLTQTDQVSALMQSVDLLKEREVPITLSHPIHDDSFAELPDLYDFAYQQSAHLLLHYHHRQALSPEERNYIKRYKGIRGCTVLKRYGRPEIRCHSFPGPSHPNPMNWLLFQGQWAMRDFLAKFSPKYWLQSRYG